MNTNEEEPHPIHRGRFNLGPPQVKGFILVVYSRFLPVEFFEHGSIGINQSNLQGHLADGVS